MHHGCYEGVQQLCEGIERNDADKDNIYLILYLIRSLLDKRENYARYAHQQSRGIQGDMRHIYLVHFPHRLSENGTILLYADPETLKPQNHRPVLRLFTLSPHYTAA